MYSTKGPNRGYVLCNHGNGVLPIGYNGGEDAPKHDAAPTTKAGEPRGFDNVDLSISAQHAGKTKYDVEAAGTKKSAKDGTESERSVHSCWFLFFAVLLGISFFVALGLGLGLGHPDPKLNPFQFFNGAVASDHELCSRVGRDLMLNGGNALDAAIGTAFCVGVLNLHVGGVGGGGLMTFYNISNATIADAVTTMVIDGQVVAPSVASQDMFNGQPQAAVEGGLAIAIPGQVAGLYTAHQTFKGALSWDKLIEPSIRLAEGGFEIGAALANAIKDNEVAIKADSGLSEILLNGAGEVKQEGDEVVLSKLAATLKTVQSLGADGFYKGDLAKKIVEDVIEAGGNINLTDLEKYSARISETVSVELGGGQLYGLGGVKVHAPPPPSSGILTNYILNILEGYGMYWGSRDNTDTEVETDHQMLESFKFALAEHSRLGDPAFEESVKEVVDNLKLTMTATDTRDKIKTDALEFSEYGSTYAPKMDPVGGATHISVRDGNGSAVSYTSSLSLDFGAKTRGKRTGIIFNAGMGDFTLPEESPVEGLLPSPVNYIQPGKRPLSSMTPLVLVDSDDQVKAVIGSSGGLEMITATATMAAQTLWFEDNVMDAMSSARFHTDLSVDSASKVTYNHEESMDAGVVDGLSSRGQAVDSSIPLRSSVNYIMQTKKNRWYTNSDSRTPGSGYAHY